MSLFAPVLEAERAGHNSERSGFSPSPSSSSSRDMEMWNYKTKAALLRKEGYTIPAECEENLASLALMVDKLSEQSRVETYVKHKQESMINMARPVQLLSSFFSVDTKEAVEEFEKSARSDTVARFYRAEYERATPAEIKSMSSGPSRLELYTVLCAPAAGAFIGSFLEKRRAKNMVDEYLNNYNDGYQRHSHPQKSPAQASPSPYDELRSGIDGGHGVWKSAMDSVFTAFQARKGHDESSHSIEPKMNRLQQLTAISQDTENMLAEISSMESVEATVHYKPPAPRAKIAEEEDDDDGLGVFGSDDVDDGSEV